MATAVDTFGASLRWWRTTRRYSQLELAAAAEVSSRHISFLETGKAQPSREMVTHLGRVLDLSLRDCNALLHAAGFAPAYPDRDLDAPEMDDVKRVLGQILAAHAPNPAIVVDRRGDIVDVNQSAAALTALTVLPDSPALVAPLNINRLALHPEGMRRQTRNWEVVAANILQRLEREQAHRPADEQLAALVEEVLGYPDVPELRRTAALPAGADLLVALEMETLDGVLLRLITTVATIGAPYDVTLDELRLETFFPTDDRTREYLATIG